jgi:transcriptional regulator with XRE-family HTH domain
LPAPAVLEAPARILFAVPRGIEKTTPAPSGIPSGERLRAILEERITRTGRSQRSLERELGWGHGSLGNLLRRKTEATFRHVEELAPVLGTTPLELLSEAYAVPPAPARAEELEPGWLDVLAYQATALEEAGEVLQQLQELIPRPTVEEVAEMRSGKRPVTRSAYLIAQLQAYMCDLENVASDLRVDLEYQFDPEGAEKLENFFNGLATAVQRLTPPRPAD